MPSSRALRAANARGLFERAAFVEPVGHGQRLAMVGHRQVLEAGSTRRPRHRLEVFLAVGGIGMAVQVAAQVLARDERWQRTPLGGFDLAAVLAQFRRDPRQAERGVDVLFAGPGHYHAIGQAGQAVLVQTQAERNRAIAQRDVVALGAGEILKRGALLRGRHEPEIRLQA